LAYADYERRKQELVLAPPNAAERVADSLLTAYIERRQVAGEIARGNEACIGTESARFFHTPANRSHLRALHQYKDMGATLDRVLTMAPKDIPSRVRRALVDLEERADPHFSTAQLTRF